MVALIAWAAEYFLESFGAHLAFRRRILPLAVYLFFRAFADLATFVIMYANHGGDLYAWSYWIQQAGSALLLCWLCVAIFAQMMGERDYGPYVAFIEGCGLLAALIGIVRAESVQGAILGAALSFDLLLGLAMLVGLMSKKARLTAQWTAIAWGVCIQLGSQGIIRGIAHYDERALAWLPLGAIAALGVWVWAGWKQQLLEAVPLGEARTSLPPRMPNRTLWLDESSRMVN